MSLSSTIRKGLALISPSKSATTRGSKDPLPTTNDSSGDGAVGGITGDKPNKVDQTDTAGPSEQAASSGTKGVDNVSKLCGECQLPTDSKQSESISCNFCKTCFCRSCVKLKKPEIAALSRPDVFWSCSTCQSAAKKLVASFALSGNEPGIASPNTVAPRETILVELNNIEISIEESLQKLEQNIAKHISELVKTDLPAILKGGVAADFSTTVEKKVGRLFSEVVGNSSLKPDSTSSTPGTSKGGPTIVSAIRQVIRDEKTEEKNKTDRATNFLIHRAAESSANSAEERKQEDADLVASLLNQIEVVAEPVEIFRLGRYKVTLDEGEERRNRPLKVVMPTTESQSKAMNNLGLLKNAPAQLKRLNIAHDLTMDERTTVREKVALAKAKSERSDVWTYRIRGPPWDLKEVRTKKMVVNLEEDDAE